MSSMFKTASPDDLRAMRADAERLDKLEGFDQALAASGLTVATPDDPEVARLHQRHGVQHDPKPTDYSFQYRDTSSPKFVEEDTAARTWAASTRMTPGFAAGILDRLQETAAEIASLSPEALEDRRLKAEAMLGQEQYAQIVSKAKAVAGDIKFLKARSNRDGHVVGQLLGPLQRPTNGTGGETRHEEEMNSSEHQHGTGVGPDSPVTPSTLASSGARSGI